MLCSVIYLYLKNVSGIIKLAGDKFFICFGVKFKTCFVYQLASLL